VIRYSGDYHGIRAVNEFIVFVIRYSGDYHGIRAVK